MSAFTIDDLKKIMAACAEVDGTAVDLDGDLLDISFKDLDFDSLAVLEIATRIQQEFGLRVPDEAVDGMKVPRDVLDYVNSQMAGR
jgi:act minimal PKS acyl carrier protein